VKLKNRVIYPSRAILSFLSTSDVNFFSNFGLKVWLTDSLITDKSFFSRRPATSFYISGREINKEWVKFSSKFVLTPGSYYIYFYFDNQAQIHTRTSNVYFDNFDITIIEKPEEKLQFISKGIRFQRGKLDLEKSSFLHVDSLIEFLNNHKNKYIGIKVYTDNKGNKDSLLLLSEKQSIALKTLLTDRGISETRIFKTEGLGCENPLNNNKTEDERKRNRRVVIYFIESEKKLD
jgi:outer membrane protein OmpA-like peptidoglycan-associated protein